MPATQNVIMLFVPVAPLTAIIANYAQRTLADETEALQAKARDCMAKIQARLRGQQSSTPTAPEAADNVRRNSRDTDDAKHDDNNSVVPPATTTAEGASS